MKRQRISETGNLSFKEAWNLYKKSFPREERRVLTSQKRIINDPRYHFEIITDQGTVTGLLLWWQFHELRYIEHLAIKPALRGKGLGKSIVSDFIKENSDLIILEVEKPGDKQMNERRINFYRRLGFYLNDYHYKQPSYTKQGKAVPLMLMTWPEPIGTEILTYFKTTCHAAVYRHE